MNKKEKAAKLLADAKIKNLDETIKSQNDLLGRALKGWKKTIDSMRQNIVIDALFNVLFYLAGMAAGIIFFAM